MSHYRDDLDAAHNRIQALEAAVMARDREIVDREARLREQEEEMSRLRHNAALLATMPPHASSTAPPGQGLSRVVAIAALTCAAAAVAALIALPGAQTAAPPPAATVTTTSPARDTLYARMRRLLEPKVMRARHRLRANEEEIELLRDLCAAMGDRACRDRTQALLDESLAPGDYDPLGTRR